MYRQPYIAKYLIIKANNLMYEELVKKAVFLFSHCTDVLSQRKKYRISLKIVKQLIHLSIVWSTLYFLKEIKST